MHLLEKIYNSRNTLRKILENEWNTEDINDFSLKELDFVFLTFFFDNKDI